MRTGPWSSRSTSLGRKLVADAEERQFEAVRYADFIEDAAEMVLDRLFADRKFHGDFLIGMAFHDRGHHFQLPRSEAKFFRGIFGVRHLQRLDQSAHLVTPDPE